MKLEIISPESTLFSGEVEMITLPGIMGSFTLLSHHAPIISGLKEGRLIYRTGQKDFEMMINGGFVEMNNDTISVCID